jgi:lysophospholipase L1-like esterase
MLGSTTQVQAMLAAKPTFVSVHLGDNDVVEPVLAGSLQSLTSLTGFQASYGAVVAAMLANKKLEGAILVGVIDPVIAMPLLQPGAYYFLARDPATGQFLGKPVNSNCSPVTALGQPNPLAANLVSGLIVTSALPEINCDPSAYAPGDPRRGAFLLDPSEIATVRARVAQYNAVIQQFANANGWAYLDPNGIIAAALATRINGRANLLRKCQDLPTATTAAQFQAAVLNTCPVTGPTAAPNFFGALISFDGVHPSATGHVVFANALADAINTRYGTALPVF